MEYSHMDRTYTHRTLVQKLGVKQGMYILFVNEPNNYRRLLQELPPNLSITAFSFDDLSIKDTYDLIQVFTQSQERLRDIFPILKTSIKKDGMIWVSCPKGHSDIRSNLNEALVRNIGLTEGLVDVKVISVNERWSSLKFVYRLKDRG